MKKLSILLALLTVLSALPAPLPAFAASGSILPAKVLLYGDANGDGEVSSKDLSQMRKYFAAYDYTTGLSSSAVYEGADANADGEINSKDLSLLRKYFASYDYTTGTSAVVLGKEFPVGSVYDEASFLAMKPDGEYRLARDIMLTSSYPGTFRGVLDGQGHTATLFGTAMFSDLSGTVSDLTLIGEDVTASGDFAPLALTSSQGMTANAVTNRINVTVSGLGKSAAGLLANAAPRTLCTFDGCVNEGAITSVSTAGTSASETQFLAGGIAAHASSVIAVNCKNIGTVSASAGSRTSPLGIAGGIVALAADSAGKNTVELTQCENDGAVTGSSDAGGIAGYLGCSESRANANDSMPYTIRSCTNRGTVTGHRYAGGLLGYAYTSGSTALLSVTCNVNSGAVLGGRNDKADGSAQTGFCSPLVAYSNSPFNEIAWNVGAGTVAAHGEAGTTAPVFAFLGCSSANYNADPYIHDNYVADTRLAWLSYSVNTAENRHDAAWGTARGYFTFTTDAQLASGEVTYAINAAGKSECFWQKIGSDPLPVTDPAAPHVSKSGAGYANSSAAPVFPEKSMDGKKVMFIGNSFIYYGGVVVTGGQKSTDKGWFYQICQANGENCTVYDYTYGGKDLDYIYNTYLKGTTYSGFDYLFISEAGENCATTWATIQKIQKLFTGNPQIVYLNHTYTVYKNHTKLSNQFAEMKAAGVLLVNWGQAVVDLYEKTVKAPGAANSFKKTSFIKNKGDDHHPNPLSGYIAAMMAYCAVTEKSCVGQFPNANTVGNTIKYGSSVTGYDAYIAEHYSAASDTNFKTVMASAADMQGLQMIMDRYLENEGIRLSRSCAHDFVPGRLIATETASGYNIYEAVCSHCGVKKNVQIPIPGAEACNVMYVSPAVLKSSGYTTVKDYMTAGQGNVFYRGSVASCNHQWGREGYSAIYGMASVCDGSLSCRQTTDASVLCWKLASGSTLYAADASTGTGARYRALIGYEFSQPVTVDAFKLYADGKTQALTGFDILGGKKDSTGKITWTVLWSGSALTSAASGAGEARFTTYDASTVVISDDLDQTATIDCVQIAVTSASASVIYISEFELIGQFSE